MKLRDIGFEFGFGDWVADGQVHHQSILSKAWPLIVYVQQVVTKSKVQTNGINSILFTPVQERALLEPKNRRGNLCVDVRIDWDAFAKISEPDAFNALFCDLFRQGFDRIPEGYDIPIKLLKEAVQNFQQGGFVNEWTFKTRHFRAQKVKAQLNCALDTGNFRLTLVVSKNNTDIFNEVILETYTDPLYYYYEFKDIHLIENQIVVLRREPKLIDGVAKDIPLIQWDLPV